MRSRFAVLLFVSVASAAAPPPRPAVAVYGPALPGEAAVKPAWPLTEEVRFPKRKWQRPCIYVPDPDDMPRLGPRYDGWGCLVTHLFVLRPSAEPRLPGWGDDPNFLLYPPAHQPGLVNVDDTASDQMCAFEGCAARQREVACSGFRCPEERLPRAVLRNDVGPCPWHTGSRPVVGVLYDLLAAGNALDAMARLGRLDGRHVTPDGLTFYCLDMTGGADVRPLQKADPICLDPKEPCLAHQLVSVWVSSFGEYIGLKVDTVGGEIYEPSGRYIMGPGFCR